MTTQVFGAIVTLILCATAQAHGASDELVYIGCVSTPEACEQSCKDRGLGSPVVDDSAQECGNRLTCHCNSK